MFHIESNSPQHLKVGKAGEDIACKYLKNKGYKIIERNFRRKWGEIDIVCLKKNNNGSIWNKIANNVLVVLQGTNYNRQNLNIDLCDDPQEASNNKLIFVEVKTLKEGSGLSPEDNLTYSKQKKLIRTCKLYVSNNPTYADYDWQIDVILININSDLKKAKIKHMESAIY
ncbi:MAG: YraN family protein [bacterium]|nr:YraN family protein [bacterium]